MKRTPLPPSPRLSPYQTQECINKAFELDNEEKRIAQIVDCLWKSLAQFGQWTDMGDNFPGLYQKMMELRKTGVTEGGS